LRSRPELEILCPIVIANTISMVDGFAINQIATEQIFRHQDVLEDIAASRTRGWLGTRTIT
jgi:hypothetical protein